MIKIIDTFNVGTSNPIDSRFLHLTISEALKNITPPERYQGLQVYIEDEKEFYYFDSGIEDNDFVPLSSSLLQNQKYIYYEQKKSQSKDLPKDTLYSPVKNLKIQGVTLNNWLLNPNFKQNTNGWDSTGCFIERNEKNQVVLTASAGIRQYFRLEQKMSRPVKDEIFFVYAAFGESNLSIKNCEISLNDNTTKVFSEKIDASGELAFKTNKITTTNSLNIFFQFNFNSNTSWGGTTAKINPGLVLVNMTELGIEEYSEEEMFKLVKSGNLEYVSGVKNPEISIKGKNLFNSEKLNFQKDLDENGNFIDSLNTSVSNFIKVEPNTTYTVTNNGNPTFFQFDKTKNIIGSSDNTTITTSSRTLFLVIKFTNLTDFSSIQLEKNSFSTDFENYLESSLKLNCELNSFQNIGDMIIEKNNFLYYIKNIDSFQIEVTELNDETFSSFGSVDKLSFKKPTYIPDNAKNFYFFRMTGLEDSSSWQSSPWTIGINLDSSDSLDFIFEKDYFNNIQEAKDFINGKTLYWIKNISETIKLNTGFLTNYPNGSCYLSSNSFMPIEVNFSIPTNLNAQLKEVIKSNEKISNCLQLETKNINSQVTNSGSDSSSNPTNPTNPNIPTGVTYDSPTLLNGWHNADGEYENFNYYKSSEGIVYFSGVIQGSSNSPMHILPTSCRPSGTNVFSCRRDGGDIEIFIKANGEVYKTNYMGIGERWVSLAGISFKVKDE